MKIEQNSRIVEAAFDEWAKNHFSNTSLSLVASRLSVTKQALYRHFPNKNALIAAMVERLRQDYTDMTDRFAQDLGREQDCGDSMLTRALSCYADRYMEFLETNPNYYIFLAMYYAHAREFADQEVFRQTARQRELLREALAPVLSELTESEWELVLYHLTLTASLMSALYYWTVDGRRRPVPEDDERLRSLHAERVAAALEHGLMPNARVDLDFAAIEERFTVSAAELDAPNRIVKAVERTVAAHGLAGASLERIAADAGISKSTIYFYFTNKDDMLDKMILHEQSQLTALWLSKAERSTRVGELTYGYMVTLSSYFVRNTALLSMFEWLRYHRIKPHMPEQRRDRLEEPLSFLREAMKSDPSIGSGLSFSELAALLWTVVLWRVFTLRPRFDPVEMVRSMRMSYRLFALGFEQLKPSKE
ncbi:TetR/AcrR family transcriptional regulator [Salinispira pacifica]